MSETKGILSEDGLAIARTFQEIWGFLFAIKAEVSRPIHIHEIVESEQMARIAEGETAEEVLL